METESYLNNQLPIPVEIDAIERASRLKNILKKAAFIGASVLSTVGITSFGADLASATQPQQTEATTTTTTEGQVETSTPLPDDIPLTYVWADGYVQPSASTFDYGYTFDPDKTTVGIASADSSNSLPFSYYTVSSNGAVKPFGTIDYYGDTSEMKLNKPIVGMHATPDDEGYWEVGADGGVFSFGDAGFYGSEGATKLNEPIVGMQSTPDGKGYWLAGADGGVFAYGDAPYLGSSSENGQGSGTVGIVQLNSKEEGYGEINSLGTFSYYFANGCNGVGAPTGVRPDVPVVGATGFSQ
jgi:hypothetical protein